MSEANMEKESYSYALSYMYSYVFGENKKGSGFLVDNDKQYRVSKEYIAAVEELCLQYCKRAAIMFVKYKLTEDDIKVAENQYYNKPQQISGKTWVDSEYSSYAFQFVYLSRKLVRRVVMVLEMCVNAYKQGILSIGTTNNLVVIGGGPCVEGLVFRTFVQLVLGKSVNIISYDKNDWSNLLPASVKFINEGWTGADVKVGDSIFVSYVMEHYVQLPIQAYIDRGCPVYSIEKEYFVRDYAHRNLHDFSGVDTSRVVYIDFVYDDKTWITKYNQWITSVGSMKEAKYLPKPVHVKNGFEYQYDNKARVSERCMWVNKFQIKATNYLDYGCGDMELTKEVAKAIGAEKYVGVDIEPCTEPHFKRSDGKTIPCDDNEFDFITAFVVFHHVKDLTSMFSELVRVLQPGGKLLIREHNIRSGDVLWVDYVHLVDALRRRVTYEKFVSNYYAVYNSRSNWSRMLEDCGFHSIGFNTYSGYNPQCLYFELFEYGGSKEIPNIIDGFRTCMSDGKMFSTLRKQKLRQSVRYVSRKCQLDVNMVKKIVVSGWRDQSVYGQLFSIKIG